MISELWKKFVFYIIQKKKLLITPESSQILCDYQKELYVIDITELLKEYISNDNKHIYLLSIIDNYIINNKDKETILINIKLKRKVFKNNDFQNFYKKMIYIVDLRKIISLLKKWLKIN